MIRRYQDTDCDAVLRVWRAATALAHPFLDADFLDREGREIRDAHLPAAETWVREVEGEVIGFISLLGNEVGALFVDPPRHRSGIGAALVDHARARHGALEVEVFEDNTVGRAFYAKYGFKPLRRRVHEPTGRVLLRLRLGDSVRRATGGQPGEV